MIALNKNRNSIIIIVLIMLFMILPYVLFGKNCIVTIHDNLDSNIPWFKYIRDNSYFFDLNTKSTTLDNLSTLYFAGDFTLKGFVYYLSNDFMAYTILYTFSIVVGFISMRKLLFLIFGYTKHTFILSFVSLMYAILPVFPGYRIAVATLPLGIYLIFEVFDSFKYKYLLLSLIFPFFSVFESVLIFLLGYWFIFIILTSFIFRKVQFKSLFCFVLMIIGTVATNCRLFLLRLIYNEPLNRDIFNIGIINDTAANIKNTFYYFSKYFAIGYPHASSLHLYIILPITFIAVLLIFRSLLHNCFRVRNVMVNTYQRVMLICLSLIVVHCIIISLNEQAILYMIFKLVLPPLSGLSFARLYIFNNVMWYIIFACVLQCVYEAKIRFNRILTIILIAFQLFVIIFKNSYYQDSWNSWKSNLISNEGSISYNEFFATSLYDHIKQDIGYKGEIAIAVGYHPSVLMYNGFNTADGYISVFPLKDALKFKELIQPELDVNDWANRYYTGWPARRYIYNKDISYEPTKEPYYSNIELRVNMDVFIEHYKGKYIISRANIANSEDLNLLFVNSYKISDGIYELFVYKTKD